MLIVSKMFNSSSTCFTQKIAWKGVETRWSVRVFFCWMSQPMAFQGKIDYCYWGLWGQVHPPSFRFCHRCRFVRMLGRCFREFGLNLGTAISIIVRVFRVVFNWCGSLGMTGCLDCRKWSAFDFGNYDAIMLYNVWFARKRLCIFEPDSLTVNQSDTTMCEEFGRNGYCRGTHYSPRRGDWSLGLSKCPATEGSPNWFDSSRIKRKKTGRVWCGQHLKRTCCGVAPFLLTALDPCKCDSCFSMFESFSFFGFVEFFLFKQFRGHGTTSGTMAVRLVDFQNQVFTRSRYWGLCSPD